MKKILFISGSVGLGHVSRDLAIVRELRAGRVATVVDVLSLWFPPSGRASSWVFLSS